MSYKPGDTIDLFFLTYLAGVLTDADSTPTGKLVHNGSDDGSVAVTIANVTTGRYKATCTIPSSGYALADKVSLRIMATVDSVAGECFLLQTILDSKRVGDLHDLAAGAQMDLVNAPNATAVTALQSGMATHTDATTLLSAVNGLNNLSALANLFAPATFVHSASQALGYPLAVVVRDSEGLLVDLDAAPTLTAANAAGTSRSTNISAVTHASTGVYTATYTVQTGDPDEGLLLTATGTVSSVARLATAAATVADVDYLTAVNAILAQVNLIGTNSGDSPNAVTAQGSAATAASNSATLLTDVGLVVTTSHFDARTGTPAGDSMSADIAAVKSDTGAILQIENGDQYIDTSTNPWEAVLMIAGAGPPTPGGGENELWRKKLRDVTGAAIQSATAAPIGQIESS